MPLEAQGNDVPMQPTQSTQTRSHPNWDASDNLITVLATNAREHGTDIAMRERDRGIWQQYTWQDYLERVVAAAAGLETLGLQPQDKMLVVGDNRPALYIGMLGAITLRAIPSPAFPDATPKELSGQIEREGIRFALAEDQEQVDKLLDLRDAGIAFDHIVYDDPRGLAGKEPDGVIAFADIVHAGRERLQADSGLQQQLIERPQANDIAVLLHSSGTTGAPKGIPLKHGHALFSVRSAARAGYFREGETHLAYMPMAWVGDFVFSIAAALALRFSINIPENQETIQHDLREIAPTTYFNSPRAWSTMLTRIQVGIDESSAFKRRLYNHFMPFAIELERKRLDGHKPGLGARLWRRLGELLIYGPIKDQLGLRRVEMPYTAGESIGEETFLFFRALGLNMRQFYGQTENSALCAAQDPDTIKLHTVGKPFPGVDIKISNEGEILVRGDNVFDGYYNHPDATAEALQDGWLHTGDAGHFEDDGQLVVLGRVSEVVYTGSGERFIPTYIENQVKFSQYIKDICVLGDGRDYLAALAAMDISAVGHWAQENGVTYTSFADLSQKPEVLDLLSELIRHINAKLPEGLHIRRFVNLHKEFDPDDGEVTRTRKLRRSVIADHYGAIIDAIYNGDDSIDFEAEIMYETGESGTLKRHLTIRDVAAQATRKAAA